MQTGRNRSVTEGAPGLALSTDPWETLREGAVLTGKKGPSASCSEVIFALPLPLITWLQLGVHIGACLPM